MYRVDVFLLTDGNTGHLTLHVNVKAASVEEARKKVNLSEDGQLLIVEGENHTIEAVSNRVVAIQIYVKQELTAY